MIQRKINPEPGKQRNNRTEAVMLVIILMVLTVLAIPPFAFSQWSDQEMLEAKQLANTTGKKRITLLENLTYKYKSTYPGRAIKFGEQALALLKQSPYRRIELELYNYISIAYCELGDYKTAMNYAWKAERDAEKAGLHSMMANTLNIKGRIYYYQGQYDMAGLYYRQALDTFMKNDLKRGASMMLRNIGALYLERGDFQNGLSSYLKALDIAKETKDTFEISASLYSMGDFYELRKDYEKAKQYYLEALELAEKNNYLSTLSDCCRGIGWIYYQEKKHRRAIEYHFKSLALSEKLGDKRKMSHDYNNIGLGYFFLNQTDKALFYFNKALSLRARINSLIGKAATLRNIGIIYIRKKQYDIAISHLKQALETVVSILSSDFKTAFYKRIGEKPKFSTFYVNRIQASIHKHLAFAYAGANNFKNAYRNYKQSQLIEDEIFNRENTAAINRIETQNRTRLKEKELEILEKDNHIYELTLDGHRILRNVFIAVFVLILVLQLFIYSRYRLKNRMNKMLEEKNKELDTANKKLRESEANLRDMNHTRDKFFSIIAHDLKNPIHSFIDTSDSLADNFDEMSRERARGFIRDLHIRSRYLYALLENLFQWGGAQTGRITFSPEKVDIFEAVDMVIYLAAQNAESKRVSVVTLVAPGTSVHADRNMAATILRNLLDNAVKFSHSSEQVTIEAVRKNQWVEIFVRDTGTGMSAEVKNNLFKIDSTVSTPGTIGEKGTGLGLIICKEFIEKHGGQIRVHTSLNRGTTISFTLPQSKKNHPQITQI